MTGLYLARGGTLDNPVFKVTEGTLIKNNDIWFGVSKSDSKPKGNWIITELSTGMKAHERDKHFMKKAEALAEAKSEKFYQSVTELINGKYSDLRSKEMIDNARKLCEAAYYDKRHDNNIELAKTAIKIFL